MKRKEYNSAPLPFQGQKRRFAKEYIKILRQYPDDAVFVDLFGGSGLLSHITKRQKPNATVVYNDFDNYRQRLVHIEQTNELLGQLREVVKDVPRAKLMPGDVKAAVIRCIEEHNARYGYVDYITLSSSLMFSAEYATTLNGFKKESMYNRVRRSDYSLCEDYLSGLTIVSEDYKSLFDRYKEIPNVVFLVDPPYLNTEVDSYNMNWRLGDYLDVVLVLLKHPFVFFTSNRSSVVELCEWLAHNGGLPNPFGRCNKIEIEALLNHHAGYIDMMYYTTFKG